MQRPPNSPLQVARRDESMVLFDQNLILFADTDCYIPFDYSCTIASKLFGRRFSAFLMNVILRKYHAVLLTLSASAFILQASVYFVYSVSKWSLILSLCWIPGLVYSITSCLLLQYDIVVIGLQHFESIYLVFNICLFTLLFPHSNGGYASAYTAAAAAFATFTAGAFMDAWPVSFRSVEKKFTTIHSRLKILESNKYEEPKTSRMAYRNSKISPAPVVDMESSIRSPMEYSLETNYQPAYFVYLSKRMLHAVLNSTGKGAPFLKKAQHHLMRFFFYGAPSVAVTNVCILASFATYIHCYINEKELESKTIQILGIDIETLSLFRSSLAGMTLMFTRKAYLLTFHPLRLSCISRKQLRIPLSRSWPRLLANKKLIHALRQANSFTPQSLCTAPPNIIQVANKEIVLFQSNATKHASTLAHSHTHPAMAAIQTDKAVNSDSQRSSKAARSVRSSAMSVARHPFEASSLQQIYIVRESGMCEADDRKQEDKRCNEVLCAHDAGEDMSKRDERDEGGMMEEVCIVQIDADGEEEEKETGDMQDAVKGQYAEEGVGCKDQRQEGGGEDGDGQDKNGEDGVGQENKEGRVKGKMYERMMGITTPVDDMFVVDYSKLVIDRMFGFHVSQKIVKRIRSTLGILMIVSFAGPIGFMIHMLVENYYLDFVLVFLYTGMFLQRFMTFLVFSWDALRLGLFQFENVFALTNTSILFSVLSYGCLNSHIRLMGSLVMWSSTSLVLFLDAEPISMRQFDSLISGWINRFDATGKLDSPHLVARLLFVAQKGLGVENAALHHCIEDMLDTDEDSNNEVHGVEMDEIDSRGSMLHRFKNIPKPFILQTFYLVYAGSMLLALNVLNEYDLMPNVEAFSFSFLGSWESKALIRTGCFNTFIVLCKRLWCQLKDPFRCHSFDRHIIKVPLVSGLRQFEDVSLPAETDLPWT